MEEVTYSKLVGVHVRIKEAYIGCKYSLDPNRPRYESMKLLAYELNISVGKLRSWMSGKVKPSFDEMINFAFVTRTSLDWLAAGGDDYGFFDDVPEVWDLMDYPEWWTAVELSKMKLASLPSRVESIEALLERSIHFKGRFGGPKGRKRKCSEGGSKYHFQTLPITTQCELQSLGLSGSVIVKDFRDGGNKK